MEIILVKFRLFKCGPHKVCLCEKPRTRTQLCTFKTPARTFHGKTTVSRQLRTTCINVNLTRKNAVTPSTEADNCWDFFITFFLLCMHAAIEMHKSTGQKHFSHNTLFTEVPRARSVGVTGRTLDADVRLTGAKFHAVTLKNRNKQSRQLSQYSKE